MRKLNSNSLKDQLHANLHQKFNHSGVDSERLVLLKKLLLDFVSSFVESHKYYNRNESLHPAYDFDTSHGQNGHVSHSHLSHTNDVSHSPPRSNYENSSEHITINTHPNANISSNTNNLPSNSHDSAMNLSATINQMIDDTLNSSANHRQESNPRMSHTDHQIRHSHSEQQSFNTSHHLTSEKDPEERVRYQSEQNDEMHDSEHHPVNRSPEPIARQNVTSEPSNISQSTKPRRSKQLEDDEYIPGPKKTPKKVTTDLNSPFTCLRPKLAITEPKNSISKIIFSVEYRLHRQRKKSKIDSMV